MLSTIIKDDFMIAYKAKEFDRKNSLGLVKSEIINLEKTKWEANDIEVIKVIKKLLKGINDSLKVNQNNKELLIEKDLFESYLPKQLSEFEIKEILLSLKDESRKNVGFIMKYFNENYNWKVDNNLVISVIKKL